MFEVIGKQKQEIRENHLTICSECRLRAVKEDTCPDCKKCVVCQLADWPNSQCPACETKWNAVTIDTLEVKNAD